MENSRPAMVVYVESPSRPAAIAVPKYRPDCAAAAPKVLAAAFAGGIITAARATATAANAAPTTTLTRNDRLRRALPRWTGELTATMASFSKTHSGRDISTPRPAERPVRHADADAGTTRTHGGCPMFSDAR